MHAERIADARGQTSLPLESGVGAGSGEGMLSNLGPATVAARLNYERSLTPIDLVEWLSEALWQVIGARCIPG